ncbi:VOC family protein [Novosphingobium lentum]|uniref:VOC family protein n=1 Tax=Novosphingobium lentum TaxID=145287 RepID=UPI000829CCE9|nr:VOC family protein [Novosphingobium lentum]
MPHPVRFGRLGFCRLACRDLAASTAFYRDLVGLAVERADDREVWLRCSDQPHDMVLVQSDAPGLVGAGFEVEDAGQLDALFALLDAAGLAPFRHDANACATRLVAGAIGVTDPVSGLALEFFCGQATAATPYVAQHTRIERMGHLVLNVADLDAAHRFWVDLLGFAVSDRVEGTAEWLRAWPNPLHHSLALLQHDANTLHHINFMVTDIDDIGRATNRLKAAGVPIVFGPGRHLPSTSVFLYFLDPDGNTAELSFGMELFVEAGARDARELEHKPEVMDTWGGKPDPRFGKGQPVLAAHV